MRQILKNGVHRTLVSTGIGALSRRRHSNSAVILAYHNIIPDGETAGGERGLHLDQEEFGRQLDRLSRTHEIRPLESVLADNDSERPRAAISFDDGYRGALTAGVEELTSRSLPATFFVSPGLLDRTVFWWDAIASASSGTIPEHVRTTAMRRHRGRQEEILEWARLEDIGVAGVPEYCRTADARELRTASERPGITVGSHTWSHPNLAMVEASTVRAEIQGARSWLRDELESVVPWIAYPYGNVPQEQSLSCILESERAVTTEAELLELDDAHVDRRRIPRINVPADLSLARFELLTSGL